MEASTESKSSPLRAIAWVPLVFGCALPFLMALWDNSSVSDRLGAIAGVTAWALLMVFIDTRLQGPGSSFASRVLMACAGLLMALEWIALAAFSEIVLFSLFSPAVLFAVRLPFLLRQTSDFGTALVLTLVCGGQALLFVLGLGWVAKAFRRHRSASGALVT